MPGQGMMVVLDVIDSLDPDVTEVDLRYGAVSYKTRNSDRSYQLRGGAFNNDSNRR